MNELQKAHAAYFQASAAVGSVRTIEAQLYNALAILQRTDAQSPLIDGMCEAIRVVRREIERYQSDADFYFNSYTAQMNTALAIHKMMTSTSFGGI